VATGNYNPVTAALYEDIGLLTSREDVTRDVAELFQRLTSGSSSRNYEKLLVAPEGLRLGLLDRIAREARAGGRIVAKVNGLSDPATIDALYAASCAGAEIDLIVRGICCLRPGVAGLSEHIRVRSVLGRYLEHSRIFRFGEPGAGEAWIGSADLMQRNLDLRVEALVKVDDEALVARIEALLAVYLDPESRAFWLAPDGTWKCTGTIDVQERIRALTPLAASPTV
jgi:polyphosphate kinase